MYLQLSYMFLFLHCFDTVCLVRGRASGLYKPMPLIPKAPFTLEIIFQKTCVNNLADASKSEDSMFVNTG